MMSWKVEEASAAISSNIHILDRGDCFEKNIAFGVLRDLAMTFHIE